jgi:nuclear transport factor 2 (NTF2) superfamily protein
MEQHNTIPPFTFESAMEKVQLIENMFNSKDPAKVATTFREDCEWRNRYALIRGKEEVFTFMTKKWTRELDYKCKHEYWAHTDNRIAIRFEYEYHNAKGHWCRAYGNECWEFDENGLMTKCYTSMNELSIKESEKKF